MDTIHMVTDNIIMLGIRFPDGAFKGKVTDTVRLIDLAPTIAEHFSLDWDNSDGTTYSALKINKKEENWSILKRVYPKKATGKKDIVSIHSRLSARYAVTDSGAMKEEFAEHILQAKEQCKLGRWKPVGGPPKPVES